MPYVVRKSLSAPEMADTRRSQQALLGHMGPYARGSELRGNRLGTRDFEFQQVLSGRMVMDGMDGMDGNGWICGRKWWLGGLTLRQLPFFSNFSLIWFDLV